MKNKSKIPPKSKEQSSKTEEKRIITYKYHYGKWLENGWLNESKNKV